MTALNVSAKAQKSLVNLLKKLGLLEKSVQAIDYSNQDLCPIAFYASLKYFDEARAINQVSHELGIAEVTFSKEVVNDAVKTLDSDRLSSVSNSKWQELRAVPIRLSLERLTVALANPLEREGVSALEFQLGLPIDVVIAKEKEILAVLGKQFNQLEGGQIAELIADGISTPATFAAPSAKESTVDAADLSAAPVIRIVNSILSGAIENGASDIHLSPQKDELAVRIRLDGVMRDLLNVPTQLQNAAISRVKLLAGMDIAEKRKPQDGRIRVKTSFGVRDLRVSSLPTAYGESVVIRVLSSDFEHLNFESLKMPQKLEWDYQNAIRSSCKVILVTGPTGSGKSSTLYTSVLALRNGKSNIITVEDPIEYKIAGINQVQVNHRIGMGFAESLRSILRQDPDIILIGEIRDVETANIAFQAAQTGHLVLSTLHTNSAAGAVTRLRDMGTPAYIIAASLGGVLAQRLVRRLCPDCSRPFNREELECLELLNLPEERLSNVRVPVGCESCSNSGYRGRQAVFSFLDVNDEVRAAIRNNQSESEIEQIAAKTSFTSLADSALELLLSGVTSVEEIERTLGPVNKLWGLNVNHNPYHDGETSTPGNALHKRKVLLVEDDPNTRTVIGMLLADHFFEVDEAENGYQALEQVFSSPPDVIVCDLMMPKMNGLEFIRKLRADTRTQHLPVLVLTAADGESTEYDLITNGADDFISKTTDSKIMLARIDRLLNRSTQ